MNSKFHLIFHIGAGKTGTSSIQRSLSNQKKDLVSAGWDYWGLMLDQCPVKKYDWQKASASKLFLALDSTMALAQVEEVLGLSIDDCLSRGVKTAIWSNEWFFGRHHNVIPALENLRKTGVSVTIVAYVRNHASWAKSAYVQWGIKHKTYSGPIVDFQEYIKSRPVRFASTLRPWLDAFPTSTYIKNFDVVSDVVEDFSRLVEIPCRIRSVRVNESPGMEELFLRAFYNSFVRDESMPVEFDRTFLIKDIDFGLRPDIWLNELLPSKDLLDMVDVEAHKDIDEINEMLKNLGEIPLSSEGAEQGKSTFDSSRLCVILAQIVMRQGVRINRMQTQMRKIIESSGHDLNKSI